MENQPQTDLTALSGIPAQEPNYCLNPAQFYQLMCLPMAVNQLFQQVNRIENTLGTLSQQIDVLQRDKPTSESGTSGTDLSVQSHVSRRNIRVSKEFPKHLACPG